MVVAVLILIFSTALFLFYMQATCELILRGRRKSPLAEMIVDASHLDFPFVRKELEEFGAPVDYPRFQRQLNRDYLALAYLLQNTGNRVRGLSREERFLAWYFRQLSAAAVAVRIAGLPEKRILLKMIAVLDFFANVLGERIEKRNFGPMTVSQYFVGV